MSVVIETTLGDVTVDLFMNERPRACLNFLKLCKIKYYNYNLFHTVSRDFIAQTGDPTGSRNGGESIYGVLEGPLKRYFEAEKQPRIKHTNMGLVSFVGNEDCMLGSQFFFTLGTDLTYLDNQHCVFGQVVEGLDVLELLNEAICDVDNRPYKDIRITHTVVLDDPMPDPMKLKVPDSSPSPSAERLQGGRIAPDEEIDETVGKDMQQIMELQAEREAKARATILEMVGDIPDADMAPPENVLFVCKLNPVTTDDDLEIIFSRFGKINSCEVIRDKKSGDSLQYAFVEFDEQKACEDAYFKMDNVLIDDRRIHVDFSQSVAKVKWHGKGRGVTTFDEKGNRTFDRQNDIGKGKYNKHRQFEAEKQQREHNRQYEDRRRDDSRNSRRYYESRSRKGDWERNRERDRHALNDRNRRHADSYRREEDRQRNIDGYSGDRRMRRDDDHDHSRRSRHDHGDGGYRNRRGEMHEESPKPEKDTAKKKKKKKDKKRRERDSSLNSSDDDESDSDSSSDDEDKDGGSKKRSSKKKLKKKKKMKKKKASKKKHSSKTKTDSSEEDSSGESSSADDERRNARHLSGRKKKRKRSV